MGEKLKTIKITHTIIWAIFVFIIFFILYSGIFNKVNILTWVAIAVVLIEGIVLIFHKWQCPFTILGKKYTQNTDVGFDIYLPKWIAKNNKAIFTPIYLIGVFIVIYRIIWR